MKSLNVFLCICFLLIISHASYSQDTTKHEPVNAEYAYLNYNSHVLIRNMMIYYSNGSEEDVKEIFALDGLQYQPSMDNYVILNKAFLYLNAKGYRLVTSSSFFNNDKAAFREYIFVREKQK